MKMTIGPKGLHLLKDFEKCHLRSYRDQAGIWTIGWGHTGPDIVANMKITQKKADELLAEDLCEAETEVNLRVSRPLTQEQFDALVCFEYNTGGLVFGKNQHSKVLKAVNRGDDEAVDELMMEWVLVNDTANPGQKIKSAGLVRRRQAEAALWIEGTAAAPNEAYTRCDSPNVTPAQIEPPSLASDKTVQTTAGIGVAAMLAETAQRIGAFADSSDTIRWIFIGLLLAGVAYAVVEAKRKG